MYKLIAILIVFLLGLYFIYYSNYNENFTSEITDKLTDKCPDVLIQKGSALFLYNSKRANVPGVNPIKFENLDEYVEFTEWQRSQGILCPILFLQHSFNTQGEPVYKARPSPTNLYGGLPDYDATGRANARANANMMPPPSKISINGICSGKNADQYIPPSSVHDIVTTGSVPSSSNNYTGFDAHNQSIGINTPLDKMFNDTTNTVSPNPMDDNWGGVEFTEKLIAQGYYKDNEVTRSTFIQ